MDGSVDHHIKLNKPDSKKIQYGFSHRWNVDFFFFKDMKLEEGLFGKRKGTLGRGDKN